MGAHTYTWVHHIVQDLNDGWDNYPARDYTMEFMVDVQLPTPSSVPQSIEPTPAMPPSRPTTLPAATVTSRACPRPEECITFPLMNASVRGKVQFRGTAKRPSFQYYKFEFRPEGAKTWSFLGRFERAVVNGVLMEWDTTGVARGTYWLRLVVVDQTDNYWPEAAEMRVVLVN